MKLGSHDVRPVSAFPKSGCTLKSEHRSQSYGQNSESACFGAPSLNLPSLTASRKQSRLPWLKSSFSASSCSLASKLAYPVWIVQSPRPVSQSQSRSSARPEQSHSPRLSSLVLPEQTQLRASETSTYVTPPPASSSSRPWTPSADPVRISLSNRLASSSASLLQAGFAHQDKKQKTSSQQTTFQSQKPALPAFTQSLTDSLVRHPDSFPPETQSSQIESKSRRLTPLLHQNSTSPSLPHSAS